MIKSDGEPAYIAGDLAYFLDKRSRGFDLCIYMLGADHHGYIARLKAAAAALGDDPDVVEVLIGQMVNLVRDGVPLRMSKRAGTVITLDDLIDALGVDAARYALIRFSVDTTLDLDLDLWTRQTSDNPVFYVQYAHARLASLARNAADLGITLGEGYDPALLDTARESELIATLAAYPEVLATAAELREPHRVARYLEDLASGYHKFYDSVRVLPMGDEPRDRRHRRPAVAVRGHPAGAGQRPGRARRRRPGADVRAHPAGPRSGELHTDLPAQGAPADLNRLDPAVWPRGASRSDDGALSLAGADVRDLAEQYRTPLMVIDEADFRSRCQDFAERLRRRHAVCTTPERRSCAPRSCAGCTTRGWRWTSAPAASCGSRCGPDSRRGGSRCTARTSPRPS